MLMSLCCPMSVLDFPSGNCSCISQDLDGSQLASGLEKLLIFYFLRVSFLCPRHKMARGYLVFALSVLPSFRHSVPSKFVFSTPPTSLHGFEWNLAGMLHHKSRSACGEIIHVRQILAELWSLTLRIRIFTHFSLSSQFLLHPCMDLNETWQGCCTTNLEVHVGR